MGYKINGEVIISNSKDIDNVGIATIGLVDAKVSAKAITEQTEGGVSDVTGADEVLIYDAEGGSLLRVTVDEFISGSGIGTLVTDFDNLVVTGVATVGVLTATWVSGNLQGVLYNSTGNPVLDPDGPGFGGTVFGNVVSNVNTGFSTFNNIMVSGMHTAGIITCDYIYGGFSGKIYNNQGNPIFNSEDASFGGTVFGDVVAGSSGLSTFKDLNVTGVATIANIAMASTQSSITLPDSAEIILGDSADFSIHHDGDHTYLDESGQGNLKIRTNNFRVTNVAETKPSITAQVTQGVELHYDGNKKLETTNTGVVVTGVITATDANFRNLQTAGITTIQDHLEVNDSTGSGTEYNLNVKTSGSSTFGVLGNGAVLLGNNSSAPFIATDDHHATSKKYVDDAIGLSTAGLASTSYVDSSVYWSRSGTNLSPSNSGDNLTNVGNITGSDRNLTIKPGGGTTDRNLNLKPNAAGAVSVGSTTAGTIQFHSATANTAYRFYQPGGVFYGALKFDNLTAVRTYTLQDIGGEVAMVGKGSVDSRYATLAYVGLSTVGLASTEYVDNAIAAAPSGVNEFVATGTIPNGDAVVINNDGTVSVVASIPTAGTAAVFNSASSSNISATYDSTNQKVVIAYRDIGNNSSGTAVVGTVSGTSISFGTPVVFAGSSRHISATYDSTNQKVVIAYRDSGNSSYGTAIVGTVSGTSISFGSPVVFNSNTSSSISATYDSTNNKVVIAYADLGNSFYGTAIVGTVSGTSISFGTPVVFNSDSSDSISATYDSTNNKVVIAYWDVGGSNDGKAIVGTVSGTSISFGTPVGFNSGSTITSATYDSTNDKVVIAYNDGANSSYGAAVVGTVSGTSISFGTPVVFNSDSSDSISATYDSTNNKVVIAYSDGGNSDYGTAVVGTVSGTSISFGTPVGLNSSSSSSISATYDFTTNEVVIAYKDDDNSGYGKASVFNLTGSSNLTSENYIGIAAEAISDGATGKITTVGGVNSQQTGLTTARKYYVQQDGSLGLAADTPSVVAGTSISESKILVR